MRTISELVRVAVANIKGNLELFSIIAVVLAALSTLQMYYAQPVPGMSFPAMGSGIVIALVVLLLTSFISLCTLHLITKKTGVTKDTALAFAKQNFLAFIWVEILCTVVIGVGFMLLIIPGLIALFFLIFTPFIFTVEGVRGFDVLKKSYEYVKVHAGALIPKLLVLLLLWIPSIILPHDFYAMRGVLDTVSVLVVFTVLQFLYFGAVAYIYELYLDVKGMKVAEPQVAAAPSPEQSV